MVSHGGKRDGAGRKSTGRSSLVLYVSSEEAEACKAIVKKMRSNELDALNSTIENKIIELMLLLSQAKDQDKKIQQHIYVLQIISLLVENLIDVNTGEIVNIKKGQKWNCSEIQ